MKTRSDSGVELKTATMRYEKNRYRVCCAFGIDARLGG